MTWQPLTQPVDYITLAGQKSPGIAEVTGADSQRDLQERKGYGLGGATVVYKGIKLIKPKVVIRLTTDDDWTAWHAWKPLLDRPPTGRRARAMDIWHPILEDQGVTAVLVESVSQPVRTKDDGEWSITVGFIEYRPVQRSLATPAGSDTTQLTPEDLNLLAVQNEGDNLRRQRDNLAGAVL